VSEHAVQYETSRDRHLFGPGPKRILSLDGGGVRGAITVAFLERIEAVLAEREGRDVHLCDYFDLVGGTSTGAIIAGALALGYRASQLKDFYLRLAPSIFRKSRWRIALWQAKFDAHALQQEIDKVVGERTLDTPDLRTGLCVVAKRMDTGSPWIIANNPRAPYWETKAQGAFIGNRYYRLSNLVRASTAAPTFFDPETLPIVEGQEYGLFVDGAVTPHNNPALALFLMTTLKPFGLCWPTGPNRLLVTSVGTGSFRTPLKATEVSRIRAIGLAIRSLQTLIHDGQDLVLTLMQWLGECAIPWEINGELGTLADNFPAGGPMFRFLRYDAKLEAPWLKDELDLKVSDDDVMRLHRLDDPDMVPLLYEIGKRAAALQVKGEHWSGQRHLKDEPVPIVLRTDGEGPSPFIVARTIDEALAAVEAGAVPVAGATIVTTKTLPDGAPVRLVDIGHIAALRAIDARPDGVTLGAAVTLAEAALPLSSHPSLGAAHAAATAIANPQVRGAGTLGGNLAATEQVTDLATALLALDARVRFAARSGPAEATIADFLADIGAAKRLITAITIPIVSDRRSTFVKFTWRHASAPAVAGVAVAARLVDGLVRDARIVVGSTVKRPVRIAQAEAALEGKILAPAAIEEAAERAAAFAPIDVPPPFGDPAYVRRALRRVVHDALACLMPVIA
jgi:CO/xanthine dehydrogenase FAD-binding subunit